jgi:hypothetical protein
MKLVIVLAAQIFFFNISHANSTYCQDYMENGIFNPIYYPDLWTMDINGKFKKNDAFLNNEDFKEHGTIEEKPEKIVLSKKFIPTVPITRTEIELDSHGKITKVNSYQVPPNSPENPTLYLTYEFRYNGGKCYPYEEWDENSGTIYNTDFCNEAKPILQAHYKKKKLKKKPIENDDDEKEAINLTLSDLLSELMKKHNIKYKDGKSYLENLELRAKKQSGNPGSIIIEKTLMITKICKEMDGVSRAVNDNSLFNKQTTNKPPGQINANNTSN